MIRDHGGFKFENEPTIVVAGNIRIAAGSMNCRIVLRKVKAGNSPSGFEYITHQENVLADFFGVDGTAYANMAEIYYTASELGALSWVSTITQLQTKRR